MRRMIRGMAAAGACCIYVAGTAAPPAHAQTIGQRDLQRGPEPGAPLTCGAWQPGTFPYGGDAVSQVLGIEPASPRALQELRTAEQGARDDAIAANNLAATTGAAFNSQVSTSIQTATGLSSATYAAGVQETLIDFASALADLASVSDYFEGVASGEMSENSWLQKLDSFYEFAKDGESLADNILDQLDPSNAEGSGPINDMFGAMGVADEYWGTDGVTNINSLKSDYSDIANIIDDYRSGKPLNTRTLGQLIIRVGKGFAENDLAERKQQIADLQSDLAAEQCASSSLAQQLQQANEAKWQAIDKLAGIRKAETELIAASPEALAVVGSPPAAGSPVERVTATCPACAGTAEQINQAATALYNATQRIAEIEAAQQALAAKKARLEQLKAELAGYDSVTAGARDSLRESEIPGLGTSQEIQDAINLRERDRTQQVNEITRLGHEIAIEEGKPAQEIAALNAARNALRERLRELREDFAYCEQTCGPGGLDGQSWAEVFGGLFGFGEIDLPQSGIGFVRDGASGEASERPAQEIEERVGSWGMEGWFYIPGTDTVLGFGRPIRAGLSYREGRERTAFDIGSGTYEGSGWPYGDEAPSSSTGIGTPGFGLNGELDLDYSVWGAELGVPIFGGQQGKKAPAKLDFVAGFRIWDREYGSAVRFSEDYGGYIYEAGQERRQLLDEVHYDLGFEGEVAVPLGGRLIGRLGGYGGLYYADRELESHERNWCGFCGEIDRDFTIDIGKSNNGWGQRARARAELEYVVTPRVSLTLGGSTAYWSDLGEVWNPSTGDEVLEGATTDLRTGSAWSWDVGGGIRVRLGD